MKVSIVVATFNREQALRQCLTSVQGQTLTATEVIVVDDASTDGTKKMVRKEFPSVQYSRLDRNSGPATARNRGIALASGDIVAFTDDDCIPPSDWIETIVGAFEERPGIIGVSGYQEASEELMAVNPVALAESLMRKQRWGERAERPQLGGVEVPGFGTNNVAYRSKALHAVNGFDESFPVAAGEDADLKLRIYKAASQTSDSNDNGPFLYLPMKVTHNRDYTWRAQWRTGIQRGIGAYHFESKHDEPPSLARIFLRCAKRTLQFLCNLWQLPWRVACVVYLTRIGDCLGQMQMALENG